MDQFSNLVSNVTSNIAYLIIFAVVFIGLSFVTLFPLSAQEPSTSSHIEVQTESEWNIHLNARIDPDGEGLWVFTSDTADSCIEVRFEVEIQQVPTGKKGAYDISDSNYYAFLDRFFEDVGTNTVETSLEAFCDLPNGDKMVAGPIKFLRYYYPNDGGEVKVTSHDDGLAELLLHSYSLSYEAFITVMTQPDLPGPLPVGNEAISEPYSFGSFTTNPLSDGPMFLTLHYPNLLSEPNPLTLRILEWNNETWNDSGDQGMNILLKPRLNKNTYKFTTYILARTLHWQDNFKTDLGLDDEVDMEHDTVNGMLKLKDSALTGMATSKSYTPTLPFKGWHSISYKAADIPKGTSLTMSVLYDNKKILSNVSSGQSLSTLDPIAYPSLQLRVDMSTTVPGVTPVLSEWSILAEADTELDSEPENRVFLPIVLK
ncbi:MAG: hypothetical protein KDJ65_14785 [Anaerolineae bacterium]|nr:hypothetical protein [Anaerolineae bacterium]